MSFWDKIKGKVALLARDEYGQESIRERASVAPTTPDTSQVMLTGLNETRWEVFTEALSTEWVARALKAAEGGDMLAQMSLFEQMEERDPSLAGAMMTRRSAPTGVDRAFLPARTTNEKDAQKAREVMQDVDEVVQGIYDFESVILDMQDAVGKGTSVLEINWNDAKDGSVDSVFHVNPRLYNFDFNSGDLYLYRPLSVFDDTEPKVFVKDHPFKFIVHRSKMRSGHAARAGALRTVAWCYVFRNYAYKDYSVYCEIFGMPMRIGKYKPTATPSDKNQLAAMLKQMASDAWAVISENTTIEFVEAVNRGQEPFSAFLSALRSEYFLAILGQEGTNVTNKYGSKGDTNIKQLVRQDILESDCRQLENTIRWQLLYPIVFYRWGKEIADKFTPILQFRCKPPLDLAQEADTDLKALVEMGLGRYVAAETLIEKYGYKKVKDDAPDEERVLPKDFQPGLPIIQPAGPGPGPNSNGESGTPQKKGSPKAQRDNAKRARAAWTLSTILSRKFQTPAERQQAVIDQFVSDVMPKADESIQLAVAPLLAAVAESKDYEELRAKLEEVYGDMDVSEFRQVLGYSMMMARLFGQSVTNENAG